MNGDVVSTEVRVRYQETDRMGVVYHANFLVWFEVGRVEFLRSMGSCYRELEERGVFFPVLEASCRYRQPARFDDRLEIRTRAERYHRARLCFRYQVNRSSDAALLAEGWTIHAATDAEGTPMRLPQSILERLNGPVEPEIQGAS